jgi:hypothetical protein
MSHIDCLNKDKLRGMELSNIDKHCALGRMVQTLLNTARSYVWSCHFFVDRESRFQNQTYITDLTVLLTILED